MEGDSAGRHEASLCAYLTKGSPSATDIEDLAAILKKAIETRDVYHTTRTSTRSTTFTALSQQKNSGNGLWNIRGLYGVYSHDFDFLGWLEDLGSEMPAAIGTSRSPGACGSRLYLRNIYLHGWTDATFMSTVNHECLYCISFSLTRYSSGSVSPKSGREAVYLAAVYVQR